MQKCRLCPNEAPILDSNGLCPTCSDLMYETLYPVKCTLCGVDTTNHGTKLCDGCWNMARNLERYVRVTRPEKVMEGLNSILNPLGYKIIQGV